MGAYAWQNKTIFEFNAAAKQPLEHAHHALETYFDYLKNSVSAFPSGGTELGETLKQGTA